MLTLFLNKWNTNPAVGRRPVGSEDACENPAHEMFFSLIPF